MWTCAAHDTAINPNLAYRIGRRVFTYSTSFGKLCRDVTGAMPYTVRGGAQQEFVTQGVNGGVNLPVAGTSLLGFRTAIPAHIRIFYDTNVNLPLLFLY